MITEINKALIHIYVVLKYCLRVSSFAILINKVMQSLLFQA